jgi:SAM-dependent methyltransferase
MFAGPADEDWERRWAPYDQDTYDQVLAYVAPCASVLDIGAGDLRLALALAERAAVVYALELQPGLMAGVERPANLVAVCGDARALPFPVGIDAAVLLMRHCRHFRLYREKLEAVGCQQLITNARWRMGIESIDLARPPTLYADLEIGWYACRCGAVGFVPGPPDKLSNGVMETIHEVIHCPEC